MHKYALLIGIDHYAAMPEAPVPAAGDDLEALAAVLRDPAAGAFATVTLLRNPDRAGLLRALDRLFTARHRDDLLLYLGCIAVADAAGRLMLLPADARGPDHPGDGVPAAMIRSRMDLSDCRQQVLLLDCTLGPATDPSHPLGAIDEWTFGGAARAVWVAATPSNAPSARGGEGAAAPRSGLTAALATALGTADPDAAARTPSLLGVHAAVERALAGPRAERGFWLGHPRLGALPLVGPLDDQSSAEDGDQPAARRTWSPSARRWRVPSTRWRSAPSRSA